MQFLRSHTSSTNPYKRSINYWLILFILLCIALFVLAIYNAGKLTVVTVRAEEAKKRTEKYFFGQAGEAKIYIIRKDGIICATTEYRNAVTTECEYMPEAKRME